MGFVMAAAAIAAVLGVARPVAAEKPAPPENVFYFGAGCSAHQCEGQNTRSDWWEFERTALADKGVFSGLAANHYELFDQDFELAERLGHDAHRFSIEWAKIEPEEGRIDPEAIAHYHRVFASLKKHGLAPFVTLWHFSLPKWFSDKGGFEKKENLRYFIEYGKRMADEYAAEMTYIITMNEPNVYAYHGYVVGKWPPARKDRRQYETVLRNLVEAHKLLYRELKTRWPRLEIGVTQNNQVFKAARPFHPLDRFVKRYLEYKWNHFFLDRIRDSLDFIGLNYYFFRCVKFERALAKDYYQYQCPTPFVTDMGWEVYPEGISPMLDDLARRYRKPIIVTENGVADAQDRLRSDYIRETLEWLFAARERGAPVFGYLHWSLTDNFEWDRGFAPRFGLIEVNYADLMRTIRPSAWRYKELIERYRNRPRR